jgi:hypothetical protein
MIECPVPQSKCGRSIDLAMPHVDFCLPRANAQIAVVETDNIQRYHPVTDGIVSRKEVIFSARRWAGTQGNRSNCHGDR